MATFLCSHMVAEISDYGSHMVAKNQNTSLPFLNIINWN